MTPLIALQDRALSLPLDDVDTDVIFPARFLLITEKTGLGRYAFHDRRRAEDFPLRAGEAAPQVLVAGRNFGCGSSREHAVWALMGLGVRVIIAESFGEIFLSNCFNNGMLPIAMDPATVARLHAAARVGEMFRVDLRTRQVGVGDRPPLLFGIGDDRREALLNGWDEITRIRVLFAPAIAAFETGQRHSAPWLWEGRPPTDGRPDPPVQA